MKYFCTSFLFLVTLFCTGQSISFPDFNFKQRLLYADVTNNTAKDINGNNIKIDTNNNGEIEFSEALTVYELRISRGVIGMNDISGIRHFTNVHTLYSNNPFDDIANFDVSAMVNLEKLYCNNTSIESINVSGLQKLKYFDCHLSHVTQLNLSGATALETLFCDSNSLSSIDLSGLIQLTTLRCTLNNLTQLDLSGLSNLELVHCTSNQITNINLDGVSHLKYFHCNSNYLTALNLTNIPTLQYLNCQINQLTELNIQGLSHLTFLDCIYNQLPSLDLTGLEDLEELHCAENNFTNLEISHLSGLTTFTCARNNLTTIDISGLSQLSKFACFGNNLQSLYMKGIAFNGESDHILALADNPNLSYICTDENKIALVRNYTDNAGYLECNIDSACALNIQNHKSGSFTIFPNPANDILNIHTSEKTNIKSVAIYNVLGQKVLSNNETELSTIDVSILQSGTYITKIQSDKGTAAIKFSKT